MMETNEQCLPPGHSPWIVYPNGGSQIFCSMSHPHEIFYKSIPELTGYTKSVAHCSGWWVLSTYDNRQYSLWNPTNSVSIHLPNFPFKHNQEINSCTLTSPPGDPNSILLLLDQGTKSVMFIRPEHKIWTNVSYCQMFIDKGVTLDRFDSLGGCLSCDGKIYVYSTFRFRLASIKVDIDDHLVLEPLPCKRPKGWSYTAAQSLCLAESRGEIFCVCVTSSGYRRDELIIPVLEVQVFKMDSSNGMAWVRAPDLMGGTIFYNGYHAIFYAALSNGIECDCVYFTRERDRECLYCYSIKDCNVQVNFPCQSLPRSCNSPIFLMPYNVRFQDLPREILQLISGFLNLSDYVVNFRAVSRACSSAAPRLDRKQALEKLQCTPLSPWLLFPTNNMTVNNFLDSRHSYRFLMKVPKTLAQYQLRFSRNCWLMMSDGDDVSFHNPFTKEIVEVPRWRPGFANSCLMCFSSLPTSSECVIVGFNHIYAGGISLKLAVTGEEGWHHYRYPLLGWHSFEFECDFRMNRSCPVICDGFFYLLGVTGNLFVFKNEEDGRGIIQWNIVGNPRPCDSYQQSYILEWDGKVASVFVGPTGKWVRVFKLNTATLTWESVENLGDHTFYVSQSSCLAPEGRCMGMQNRIYFPRVQRDSILYYSLETKKFHYDKQSHYLENFHNTKEQLLAGWFDPRCF